MKKTRLLALTLVAVIMLMGAGYAWWTDTLVINAKVSTGEFDVSFDDDLVWVAKEWYLKDNNKPGWRETTVIGEPDNIQTNGASSIEVSDVGEESNNKLSIAFSNMYPGSRVDVDATVRNNGTIPVRIKEVRVSDFEGQGSGQLKEKLLAITTITHKDALGNEVPYPNETLARTGSMIHFEENLNKLLKGKILKPNETLSFDVPKENQAARELIAEELGITVDELDEEVNCIIFQLPPYVVNSDNVENASLNFTVEIEWEQINATGFNALGNGPAL